MKMQSINFNVIAILLICALLVGIGSSYINLGFFSVFFSVVLPLLFLVNLGISILSLWKKKYFYGIGVILFLFCFSFFFRPFPSSQEKLLKSYNDSVNILSYNVRDFNVDNDINDTKIPFKILNFINNRPSDILVLQESHYKNSRGIKNYPYKFLGFRENKKKSLLAIYSKHPILNTGYIDFPNTLNNAIYADIKINQDTVRVFNIHLQSFGVELNSVKENNNRFTDFFKKINESLSEQVAQAKMVKSEVDKCDKKVIVCGDFNATQFSLPYRILKKELNDSFISKGKWLGTTYSLFGYPLRLDYFLIDKRIEILGHENFNLNLSDHEPILTTIKL